jgi:hypothetical protein
MAARRGLTRPTAERLWRRCAILKCLELALIASGLALPLTAMLAADVQFTSPGFAASSMDAQGWLVEDWGALDLKIGLVSGTGILPVESNKLEAPSHFEVQAIKLDEVIPAAQARAQHGPVRVIRTAYRAPVWPSGLDVFTVRLEETEGREQSVQLSLALPESARLGSRTVSIGSRAVVALPANARASQSRRDWGYDDDATALPGWGGPAVECDPAFRNIRAGLGGVPIHYRFKVEPRAARAVVLGFCESHWETSGQRPMICDVEGAPPQSLDCIVKWGQHQPGALQFAGKDQNGDGELTISVLPQPGAPDQNPILNAIWVFPAGQTPDLAQVIRGRLNAQALHYVDVGGANDQSLHAGGQADYTVKLPANGAQEMTFLVACSGASVPMPESTAWTPEKLRQSAAQVWRQWKEVR